MLLIGCAVLAGFIQAFCLLFGAAWLIKREKAAIRSLFRDMVKEWGESPEPDKPSKAALLLDAAGSVVGAAAARSIMASLSAEKAHVARAANGMSDELQGRQNPILGLLAGGKRGKGAAIMQLAQMLGPMLAGSNGNGSANTDTKSVRDRLKGGF